MDAIGAVKALARANPEAGRALVDAVRQAMAKAADAKKRVSGNAEAR